MKTILITGINGFLGSHLAKELINNYKIIGLEYSIQNLFRINHLQIKVYPSEYELENIFKENQIYAIIHAATIYRRANEPIENLLKTNLLLPILLFEMANQYKVNLFINTDSFFNDPKYNYSYLQDYTLSKKQALEWLVLRKESTKMINMKIFHMYGPSDSQDKFIPQIISKLIRNESQIGLTPGNQTRDFIYIKDVVSAFKVVIESFHLITDDYSEFQVGTGLSIPLKEFILLAKKITKSKSELIFGAIPYRENEIMESKSDNSGLRKLGWDSKYPLEDGIQELI